MLRDVYVFLYTYIIIFIVYWFCKEVPEWVMESCGSQGKILTFWRTD